MSIDILSSAALQAAIALQNGIPNLIKQYEDEQRQRMQAATGGIVFKEMERIRNPYDEVLKSAGLTHWSENYKNALSGLMSIDAIASLYGVDNLASLYIPDRSILIRSAPKTRHQQQKADDFKSMDSAEDAVILTEDAADYQAIVFELGRSAGIAPPQSKADEPLFMARLYQQLEGQKPKDKTEIKTSVMSELGKAGAEKRHSKPGGSRDLKRQIQEIYQTGKYSTKSLCAEEEYQSLGFGTFDTALRALRNVSLAPKAPTSA